MTKENNLVSDLIKTVIISGVLSFGAWYVIDSYQENKTESLKSEQARLISANNIIKNHNDQVTADMDAFLSSVQLEYDELHILLDIDQKLQNSNVNMDDRYISPRIDGINDATIRSDHKIPDNMGVALVDLDVHFTTAADMYTFLDSLKPENSDVLYTINYLNISDNNGEYDVDITLINYYYDTMIEAYESIFSYAMVSYNGMFYKSIAQNGEYTFKEMIDSSSSQQLQNSKYVYDYSLTKSSIRYKDGTYYMTLFEENNYFAVVIDKEYSEVSNCTNLLDLRTT